MDDPAFTAIRCIHTDLKLFECCFVSKNGFSLDCSESSNLYCKLCRSVGGHSGVTISKSRARLTDCFISEMLHVGVLANYDTERIKLKHCTITKCKGYLFMVEQKWLKL